MSTTPPGWYPDAQGTTRWWDGTQWTAQTQPGQPGQQAQPGQQGAQQQGQQPTMPMPQGGQQSGQPNPYGQQGQQGQQGQAGQPGGYGQPGQGQFQYAQPATGKKTNPALWFGIGGGVLLIVVAIVAVLLLTGGDDEDPAPVAGTSENAVPEDATEMPSATPPSDPAETEEPDPAETEEPDSGGGDEADQNAANAPKDASVDDFCTSFDLQALSELSGTSDLSKLQDLQADMLAVGTPADMPADARSGWEWFASINGPEDVSSMNNDDLTALGEYYGLNCM